jgi:hypothetical protein
MKLALRPRRGAVALIAGHDDRAGKGATVSTQQKLCAAAVETQCPDRSIDGDARPGDMAA